MTGRLLGPVSNRSKKNERMIDMCKFGLKYVLVLVAVQIVVLGCSPSVTPRTQPTPTETPPVGILEVVRGQLTATANESSGNSSQLNLTKVPPTPMEMPTGGILEIVRGQLTATAKEADGNSQQMSLTQPTPTPQEVETPTPSPISSNCDDPESHEGETLVYKNFVVVAMTEESQAKFERTSDGVSFTFCNVGVEIGNGLMFNFGAT